MGQAGRRDDRRVRDVHAVVELVAFLQAPQNGDGVLDAGLVDDDLLEPPLQRGILLDVLAVLVQGGRADAVQLAAGERGLEHVARVHGALGLARADHGVDLVDEQDDVAFLLRQLVQHRLETLLELAAELRARDQRAHVERQDPLVLQSLGHLAVEDPLGQALDDGGLAHPGLADQHGVVLGAPLQHLNGPADLVVAADHRVELACLGPGGEIHRVLVQRLARFLRIGIRHRLATPRHVHHLFESLFFDTGLLEHTGYRGIAEHRQQHLLRGQIAVAGLLCQPVRHVQHPREALSDADFAGRLAQRGQTRQRFGDGAAQCLGLAARPYQHGQHRAVPLLHQHGQQVDGFDGTVILAQSQRLRIAQRVLQAARHLVQTHGAFPLSDCCYNAADASDFKPVDVHAGASARPRPRRLITTRGARWSNDAFHASSCHCWWS